MHTEASPAHAEGSHSQPARRLSPRLYVWLYFSLVALILLVSDKGQIEGDGIKRWEALDALMSKGQLTAEKYSIVQPLFAIPLYWTGELYARASGASSEARIHAIRNTVQRFNKVMAFGLVLWLYGLLRREARWSCQKSSAAGLFLLFGSLLIPNAKDFYSECLWTLLCVLSLTTLSRFSNRPLRDIDTRMAVVFVLLVSLTIPLNPILLLVFGMLTLCVTARRLIGGSREGGRDMVATTLRADVVLTGIALLAGSCLCLMENRVRRGSPLDFGYPGEHFSTHIVAGLTGQLVSPTRGIVFFIPTFFCGVILILRARESLTPTLRRLVSSSLAFSCCLMLAYSKWHAWHGAWYWGPRFLLVLSVFGSLYFALLAQGWWRESRWKQIVLVATALMSFMIYKVGVGIGQGPLTAYLAASSDAGAYWRWQFLPFASWFSLHDVVVMCADRSTAVEALGGVMALFLVRHAPADA